MNAPLRRVGVVALILFGLLFANLNWVMAVKSDEYRTSPYNGRVMLAEYDHKRGTILAGGVALAESRVTNGDLKYLRVYPTSPAAYAHIVGFRPVQGAAIDIERTENEFLAGTSDKLFADRLRDIFSNEKTPGGNVVLSISRRAQETAFQELLKNKKGAKVGAVVALDPRTGAILAMASTPSYDPNPLVSHNTVAAEAAYNKLDRDPSEPLLNRATQETFPPGSTFKVILSAAALEAGYTINTPIPAGPSYQPPQTDHKITNAAASICPEPQVTLIEALTESCNTGYAQLGVTLGSQAIIDTATAFGFNDPALTYGRLDSDVKQSPVAESVVGKLTRDDGQPDPPKIAQSSIGQNDVRMTPMEGAMMAAPVANNGSQMRPYLVEQLLGPDLITRHYTAVPKQLRQSCTSQISSDLREMMVSAVENGTGKAAQIDGYEVGGKTGTAENAENEKDHGWFIGFARNKDGVPVAAVAVFLKNAGSGGSSESARIAGQVMKAIIADKGGK